MICKTDNFDEGGNTNSKWKYISMLLKDESSITYLCFSEFRKSICLFFLYPFQFFPSSV